MDWISNWAGGIIVAVIIGTIIEMILPEGNSKKYIKLVIGIYVLFTIVSPIITKFTGNTFEVSDVFEIDTYIEEANKAAKSSNQVLSNNEDNILSVYLSGIKSDMKAKIEEKGYVVNSIDVSIANDETYAIENISLEIEKKNKLEELEENENASYIDKHQEKIENIEKVEEIEKIEIDVESNNANEDKKDDGNDANDANDANSSSASKDSDIDSSNKEELSYLEKNELKEYLSSIYEVDKKNIVIN